MGAKKKDAVLTDEQVLIQLARESLARYGTAIPPAVSAAPTQNRKRLDPSKFDPKWRKVFHTCPKCGHSGPVATDFGVRVVRGVERLQSWCAECRNTTSYYNAPRKNVKRSP